MSSRANGYRSRKRRRSYGQSNKELRSKSVEVYRPVSRECSESIAAALETLFASEPETGVWPEIKKIPAKHQLTILSPVLVRQKFARGFEAGYNFRKAMQEIEESFESDSESTVKIGEISVFGFAGRRCHIVANIHDARHRSEQRAARKSLAEAGLRGFRGKGGRVHEVTRLIVAQTRLHVPSEKEIEMGRLHIPDSSEAPMSSQELADHVETQFVANGITAVDLRPAVVRAV